MASQLDFVRSFNGLTENSLFEKLLFYAACSVVFIDVQQTV
jgi:hypothetical protein